MIATPEELNYQIAYSAHRNTSFSPDERAKSEQNEYAAHVNGVYAKLLEIATTDAMRAVLESGIIEYKKRYFVMLCKYLNARSRTASTMITGSSNFNVRRNQKRVDIAQSRLEELLEWRERAQVLLIKRINAARTGEQVLDDEWVGVEARLKRSLSTIRAIDEDTAPYSRGLIVNNMVAKIATLANSGKVELVERAFEVVQEYNKTHQKPAVTARHAFWNLLGVARNERAKAEAATTQESTIITVGAVQIVDNIALDRIQIVLPGKPDADTHKALNCAGWNYSPTNKAWQRKRTNNAIASAKQIVSAIKQ